MKILVDENIPFAGETFGWHGDLVRFCGRELKPEDLFGTDALIIRSITRVNASLLAKHRPAFVGTCTIGTDHLDIAMLEASGIRWACAPGCNAQSVVDYVMSAIAALDGDQFVKAGDRLQVGIPGCGNVGGRLRLKMLELGFRISVYDPFLERDQIPELTSLDATFRSDIVCLHTPFTSGGPHPTANMIGLQQLELLAENAILVSAGRGGVIVENELIEFMDRRPDVRVVLDVWANEPCINAELLDRVAIATPHIAGYSVEGKRRGTEQVYQAFCEHFGLNEQALPELETAGPLTAGSLAERLLEAYDPRDDMQTMRAAYANAHDEEKASGRWFDRLRRDYPERREFLSFTG